MKKLTVLILMAAMTLNLAACGDTQKEENKAQTETTVTETVGAETAGTEVSGDSADIENRLNELWEEESSLMNENMELWGKIINNMDKSEAMSDENYNYVDALAATVESMKDEFTDEEYNTLKTGAEKIKEIEAEMAKLQEQMNDTEETATGAEENDSDKFPAFNGKDFDGNDVDESIFSQYAVTVVNFWFNGCAPCVAELPELNSLNESLAEKGGAVIGINSETLDGDADVIAQAKEILSEQGATYQNIYFDSSSEAGKMAANILAFPTTMLVDRNGNIIGEPIVGGINSEEAMNALQQRIDEILANDKQ